MVGCLRVNGIDLFESVNHLIVVDTAEARRVLSIGSWLKMFHQVHQCPQPHCSTTMSATVSP